MAKGIDEAEANSRLDFYLDLDAKLIRDPNPLPMLH
jgi:tRNA-(ms[2]io[6]A)-hydroxylase